MVVKKKICAGCDTLTYIYKNVGGKKYCKSCTYKLFPSSPIKKVSDKKKQEDVEYSKKRKLFLETHPSCQAKLPGICTINSTDVHHTKGRNINYLNVETWIALCRECHMWVENNPTDAKELGLSKNRLT
jgi:hypothetical protein